jgi:peptide/nickel transport system ATP-binding protein
MREIRGNRISMIFQEPMTSLNPVMTVGDQIMEVTRLHKGYSKIEARKQAIEMLTLVQIPDPIRRISEYPHQLSGGMKQRIMIAMALSCEPDLLIADEPTTALDVNVQAQILKLMKELQQKKGTALLLITHDMGVVYETADYVTVMYAGKAVEQAMRSRFFKHASHPYSTKLFESLPDAKKRGSKLSSISGSVPEPTQYPAGCRFAERCHLVFDKCKKQEPPLLPIEKGHTIACLLGSKAPSIANQVVLPDSRKKETSPPSDQKPLLTVKNIKIHYPIRKGLLQRLVGSVKAVDGVDITLQHGETLALVGESGCGKTTLGKGIVRLIEITEGTIDFNGTDLVKIARNNLRKLRKDFQMMFQDPYGSLNPRMMVSQIVSEGLISQKIGKNKKERTHIVKELMERVGLNSNMIHRYPHEFSGGQRQRIGIARFLAVRPKFVLCDEVTSALDVSVQAQILNLLKTLQQDERLSYIFITHNLSLAAYIAHRVAVMYLGRIVERGTAPEVFETPKHPYSKMLLDASPRIGENGSEKIFLEGDVPSPINPPQGCHFHPRCPKAMPKCGKFYPEKTSFSETHSTHCWLY